MQVTTTLTRGQRLKQHLLIIGLALGALAAVAADAVHAQNLDAGKSATRIFSDSCATCHRSARGLAKGRFRLTLYLFLQQHYASNASSAWALASYLESVDSAKRDQGKGAKRPAATTGTGRSSVRPPASVPAR